MISTNTIQNNTVTRERYDHDIKLGQLFNGLTGSAASSVIDSVGATASSIIHLPKALYNAYKATWKTQAIGPVLKTAISALLPVGALLAPPLVAIGGLGWGIVSGFGNAVDKGVAGAVKQSFEDVKNFNTQGVPKVYEWLLKAENALPPEGEKPYDIKVIEAGKGLVSAAVGAAIEGPAVGAITTARLPQGFFKVYKKIISADIGPVTKTAALVLTPPLFLLVPPLGLVGGTLYGMYAGFRDGYQKGVTESVKNRIDDVKKYNEMTKEIVDEDKPLFSFN